MKWSVGLLALLQALGCSAFPALNSELATIANKGLSLALSEVNSVYAVGHLYRVTRSSVKRVIPVSLNTNDLLLKFNVQETDCLKGSQEDPQTCAFRRKLFATSVSCSSRVRMAPTSIQVVSLKCKQDSSSSSSSSESSEEVFSQRLRQFTLPTFTIAPPRQRHFFQGETGEVQPRGDRFSNFLE